MAGFGLAARSSDLVSRTTPNQAGQTGLLEFPIHRAHFARCGPYSLDFELVYHVQSPDYGRHMDARQAINFRIHETFEALGVGFADPTQTLLIAAGPDRSCPEGRPPPRSEPRCRVSAPVADRAWRPGKPA